MSLFDGLKLFLNFFFYIYEFKSIALPVIIDLCSIDNLRLLVIFWWFFYQCKIYLLGLWQLLNIKLLLKVFEFKFSWSELGISPWIVNSRRVWCREYIVLWLLIPQSIWLRILIMICGLFVVVIRFVFVSFADHVIALIKQLFLFPKSFLGSLSLYLFFLHFWPHLYQILLYKLIDS